MPENNAPEKKPPKKDLVIVPLCEAALLLVAGGVGWALHQPMLFASLGPTAYELIETPERKTARPYNIFAGHLIGVLAGFAATYATHAFNSPGLSSGMVTLPRMGAAALAAALTVLLTLALKASQPAALATSLIIALGTFQHGRDALVIMGAVVLMLILGEPLRLWRLKDRAHSSGQFIARAS
jgi:hypothetical protein